MLYLSSKPDDVFVGAQCAVPLLCLHLSGMNLSIRVLNRMHFCESVTTAFHKNGRPLPYSCRASAHHVAAAAISRILAASGCASRACCRAIASNRRRLPCFLPSNSAGIGSQSQCYLAHIRNFCICII